MNKFGWFVCGFLALGMIIDVMFSYYNLGSVNDRVLLLVISIAGVGLMVLTQKDKPLPKKERER